MAAWELNKTILKDSSSLKAYYRFESGALTTDSKNSYTLTNNGSVGESTGVYGGCADFGSIDSTKAMLITDVFGLTNTGAKSVSLWVKLSAEVTAGIRYMFQSIINSGGQSDYFEVVYEYNAGTRRIKAGRNVNVDQRVTYNITLGTSNWYHIVCTYDGTNTTNLYINGGIVGTDTSSSGTYAETTTSKSSIGSNSAATSGFNTQGFIDDVAVFNAALSADQVKELYEGRFIGELRPQANLVALYHLNGNSTDSSGNSNNGTDTAITYGSSYGKIGTQGASFNGSSSKITILNSVDPDSYNSGYSVFLWVKLNSTADQFIFDQTGSLSWGDIMIAIQSSGKWYYRFGTGVVNNGHQTAISPSTGVWYNVVITHNTTTDRLFINGNKVDESSGGTLANNGTTIYLSSLSGSAQFLNGNLDEVAVFTRELSTTEIRKWYAWSVGKYL